MVIIDSSPESPIDLLPRKPAAAEGNEVLLDIKPGVRLVESDHIPVKVDLDLALGAL